MTDPNRSTSIFLFVILTLIWGTSFILIKQGLKVFSPDELGALRVVAASLFLLPVALSKLREVQSHHWWKLFASGMMGIFIPAFLFAAAQTRMDSSVAGIINTMTPIFTMIISVFVFNQRFRAITIVGIILAFAGATLLSLSRSGGTISGINLYALFIVAACALYGSNLNFIKFKIPDLGALTITSVSVLLIAPLGFIYLFGFTDFIPTLTHTPGAWKAFGFILILACMSTAVATILFNQLVKISTPLFASSVTYVMPIVAVMWGLLDGEQLAIGHYVGMVAIIGGVYLANKKR
ncbi:MAG TPA: DMT family transporter [Ohtaekwangia sp.]